MGMIGRWIDEKCRTEPDVMRRVLNRKFGDLSDFQSDDKCGCLVGSWEIETKRYPNLSATRSWTDGRVGYGVLALTRRYCSAGRGSGARIFRLFPHLYAERRKRPDAFVIRLLKQRIRKGLGIAPENRPASRDTEVDAQSVGACRFGRGE